MILTPSSPRLGHATTRSSHRPFTLLGVWAHPDDETYLSAALMRRVVARGGRVVLVSATRGEHGSDDPASDPAALGQLREAELRTAMAHLGVDDVRFLGHADGACADADVSTAASVVEQVIRAAHPHVVVTFGPDGITRHLDHITVSSWTTGACAAVWRSPSGIPHLPQLRYATMTDTFVERHRHAYSELPLTLDGDPAAIPDAHVALRVVPDPDERARKRAALSSHASQIGPLVSMLGEDRFHDWWVDETFRAPTPDEIAEHAPAGVPEPAVDHGDSTTSPHRLQASTRLMAHSRH